MKMEENTETIRDIAIKLLENKMKANEDSSQSTSRTIFILGPKNTGKTCLMNHFLDKNENPKETLGLEYTFGRKNLIGQFGDKNICHIWELGGDMPGAPGNLSIPLSAHNMAQLTIIVMVDLSQPHSLATALDHYITRLKSAVESRKDANLLRTRSDLPKKEATDKLFPLPLLVVGGKYDLFRELDPTHKSAIFKVLQSAALEFGAGVFFYSNKEHSLIKKSKEILNNVGLGFGNSMKTSIQDTDKPMQIRAGDDTWVKVGQPPPGWETVRAQGGAVSRPDGGPGWAVPRDPSLEPAYREPPIDTLRAHKDQQLQILMAAAGKSYF